MLFVARMPKGLGQLCEGQVLLGEHIDLPQQDLSCFLFGRKPNKLQSTIVYVHSFASAVCQEVDTFSPVWVSRSNCCMLYNQFSF